MYLYFLFLIYRILDDIEMYEQQNPFKLSNYVTMSNFLNHFLYKGILNNLFGMYNKLAIRLDKVPVPRESCPKET